MKMHREGNNVVIETASEDEAEDVQSFLSWADEKTNQIGAKSFIEFGNKLAAEIEALGVRHEQMRPFLDRMKKNEASGVG